MGLKHKRETNSEVPAASEAKKPSDYGKLPWTEEMDECLLKLALHHGAHLPHLGDKKAPKNGAPSFHPKPSDRWRDVVRDFFSDSTGGQPYSEKHFKLDKSSINLDISSFLNLKNIFAVEGVKESTEIFFLSGFSTGS